MIELRKNWFNINEEEFLSLTSQNFFFTDNLEDFITSFFSRKLKTPILRFKYDDFKTLFERGLKAYRFKTKKDKKTVYYYVVDDTALGEDYMWRTRKTRVYNTTEQIKFDLALKHYDNNIEFWKSNTLPRILDKLYGDLNIEFTKHQIIGIREKFNLEKINTTKIVQYEDYSVQQRNSSGIYAIYRIKDNVILYIGQTSNFKDRWNCHFNDLIKNKHHNSRLQGLYNQDDKIGFKIMKIIDNADSLKLGIAEAVCFCNAKPLCGSNFTMTNGSHKLFFSTTCLDIKILDLL